MLNKINIIDTIYLPESSEKFFLNKRWPEGKKFCPRCLTPSPYSLQNKDHQPKMRCTACKYTFGNFTGTFLAHLEIPANILAFLLHLFVLGIPASRAALNLDVSTKTTLKAFQVFRKSLYALGLEERRLKKISLPPGLPYYCDQKLLLSEKPWLVENEFLYVGISQRGRETFCFPLTRDYIMEMTLDEESLPAPNTLTLKDNLNAFIYFPVRKGQVVLEKLGLRQVHTEPRPAKTKRRLKPVSLTDPGRFWAFASPWIKQFLPVRATKLHLFLKEAEVRYNRRREDLFEVFAQALVRMEK